MQIFLKLGRGAAGGTEHRNLRLRGHLSGQSGAICLFTLLCFTGLKKMLTGSRSKHAKLSKGRGRSPPW